MAAHAVLFLREGSHSGLVRRFAKPLYVEIRIEGSNPSPSGKKSFDLMTSATLPKDKARFEFGENWSRFLALVDEPRIVEAERSLRDLLGLESLSGKSFLDI